MMALVRVLLTKRLLDRKGIGFKRAHTRHRHWLERLSGIGVSPYSSWWCHAHLRPWHCSAPRAAAAFYPFLRKRLFTPGSLEGLIGYLRAVQDIYPAWWGDGSEACAAATAQPTPTHRLEAGTALQRAQVERNASPYLSTPLADTEAAHLDAAAAALQAVADKLRFRAARGHENTASEIRSPKAHAQGALPGIHKNSTAASPLAIGSPEPELQNPKPHAAVLCPKSSSGAVPRLTINSYCLPLRGDAHSHSPAFLTSAERLGDASEFLHDRDARQGLPPPRTRPKKWQVVSKVCRCDSSPMCIPQWVSTARSLKSSAVPQSTVVAVWWVDSAFYYIIGWFHRV